MNHLESMIIAIKYLSCSLCGGGTHGGGRDEETQIWTPGNREGYESIWIRDEVKVR